MKITIPGIHARMKKRMGMTPGRVRRSRIGFGVVPAGLFLLGFCIFLGVGSFSGLCPAAYASVEKVDDGIQFTYYDPDAGQVFIAGSFNGWNSNANPLTRDDKGYWTIVLDLGPGEHTYKFVVDGAWITDMDNPATKSDGYGGNNSVIEIDSKGEIVAEAAVTPLSNTLLSSKIFIGGRYLSRTNYENKVAGDPRWRLQRPSHEVDFNFRITISDIVHGYSRLRINSGEKILQPNNIDAFLDEAHIEVTPDAFTLSGYYNEEVLRSNEPLGLIGDTDLPGTIFDDHLKDGKGTSGATISSTQLGIDFEGFIANVHDYDYYNDPNLYDNTGTDAVYARASKKLWKLTPGANIILQRSLWWLNFTGLVGTTPANTGIGKMDEFLDATGDPSDWFEFEDKTYLYGADLTLDLYEGKLLPQAEFLKGEIDQGFVTGNNSGLNFENGPIDVPILQRDVIILHGSIESKMIENVYANAEHTHEEIKHSEAGDAQLFPAFTYDEVANKQLYFMLSPDPPTIEQQYSEFELRWYSKKVNAVLWLERTMNRARYPTSRVRDYLYILSVSPGINAKPIGKLDIEIEHKYSQIESPAVLVSEDPTYSGIILRAPFSLTSKGLVGNPIPLGFKGSTYETIVRGSYGLTNKLSAIFDVRYLYVNDERADDSRSFTAPYAGIEYVPTKKVSVVLAYGVDPFDFGIDYQGRYTGRYRFRQEYMWELARQGIGASWIAAEEALARKDMISIRAIYNF